MSDVDALPDPGLLPEHQLQQLLLAHLNRIPGVWLWRANTGAATDASGRVIRFGRRGQGDLLGMVNGRFLAVEVKDPVTGRQNADQRDFQRLVEEHLGVYLVATHFMTAMRAVMRLSELTSRPLPF